MTTLSVVIPAYNMAPFLDGTLASLAAQIRYPDEVIVVDDASGDDTGRVAREWAPRLPVTVVRSPVNQGIGATRHLGVQHSTGDLVTFLDGDDFVSPDHLQALEALWLAHGGIVTSHHRQWVPGHSIDQHTSARLMPIPPAEQQPLAILEKNFLSAASLLSRADYDSVGGFSPRRVSEDWELWIRLIRNGLRVTAPPMATMLYRQRLGSVSANDSCLPHDIDILETVRADARPEERAVIEKSLRRRRAKLLLLDGVDALHDGDRSRATARWVHAASLDRSLRGGLSVNGSVTLRALAFMLTPQTVAQRFPRLGRRIGPAKLEPVDESPPLDEEVAR